MDWLNSIIKGNNGKEVFFWIFVTNHIIIDDDCVGLVGVSYAELQIFTIHSIVISIRNS